MEQNTLYRKYRPITFDAVVGQDPIVTALKNQIKNDKIAHAYLFCGTRGTGKTSIAKIFARAVNCKNRKDSNPCNECDICKSIFENTDMNVFEMDAAANNSIDDIRKIRELVQYPPINDEKYKVFIIDEAHELSASAADAFLKTLEEPPEYVIFILATTEPSKLKSTILSRCQRYDFRRIAIPEIVSNLKNICDKENIKYEEEALQFIAEKADGSMRESISILDSCTAFLADEIITLDKVKYILGIADETIFFELTKALTTENVKNCLNIVDQSIKNGKEITVFVNDYIHYLRNLMIVKYLDKENEILTITKEKYQELKNLSSNISIDTIVWYIERLSNLSKIMKTDENKKILLETTLIKLAVPETDYIEEAVMSRLATLERKLKQNSFINVSEMAPKEEAVEKNIDIKPQQNNKENKENKENKDNLEKKENQKTNHENPFDEDKIAETAIDSLDPFNEPAPAIVGDNVKLINTRWLEIISSFNRMTKALLKQSKVMTAQNNPEDTVFLVTRNSFSFEVLNRKEVKQEIEDAIQNIINKKINIILKDAEKEKIDIDDL